MYVTLVYIKIVKFWETKLNR